MWWHAHLTCNALLGSELSRQDDLRGLIASMDTRKPSRHAKMTRSNTDWVNSAGAE